MWSIRTQQSSIAYIDSLPSENGTYSLYLDEKCAGTVEVRSGLLPGLPSGKARVYLANIQAQIQGRLAPLTSSVQFNEDAAGAITSFLMTFVFPGIHLEGDYAATQLRLRGNFFDEPVEFETSVDSDLRFVALTTGGSTLTGATAGHPIERILQLTLQKQLKRVRIVSDRQDCHSSVDFTELIQQLKHIQHNLSSDILALNKSSPSEIHT